MLLYSNELYHHGVKGMKWGIRKKYQNADGSLNDRGVKKYAKKHMPRINFGMRVESVERMIV